MIDHNRLNGIFLTAVALYLCTSFAQLHARQPAWPTAPSVSLTAVAAAIKHGFVEAVKLEGEQNGFLASGT